MNIPKAHSHILQNLRPLSEFHGTSVTDAYMSNELGSLLQGAYLAMVDAFVSANVTLTSTIYERILPEHALKLAVHLGSLEPATPEGEVGSVGGCMLTRDFKAEMMAAMTPAIHYVRATADNISVAWLEPTPPQHIQRFLKIMKWYRTDLVKKLSGIEDHVDETWLQFLKRLYKPPTTKLQSVINPRTLAKLETLRNIMASNVPGQFGTLTTSNLRWTPL